MKSKNNPAQSLKRKLNSQMDLLIDHVDNLETDLLECRDTISRLTAENTRLIARLEAMRSLIRSNLGNEIDVPDAFSL